jgi:hypothetical protein
MKKFILLATVYCLFSATMANAMRITKPINKIYLLDSAKPTVIHDLIDGLHAVTKNSNSVNNNNTRDNFLKLIEQYILCTPSLLYTTCTSQNKAFPLLYVLSKSFPERFFHNLVERLLDITNRLNLCNILLEADSYGYTVIHYIAMINRPHVSQVILDHINKWYNQGKLTLSPSDLINKQSNIDGRTAFHIACAFGHDKTINQILLNHTDIQKLINITDFFRATPIHYLAGKPLYLYLPSIIEMLNNLGTQTPIVLKRNSSNFDLCIKTKIEAMNTISQRANPKFFRDADDMLPSDYAKIYMNQSFNPNYIDNI